MGESLGMRISACASTIPAPSSLRSVSMSIKRAALSATAVNVVLNISFSRSVPWCGQEGGLVLVTAYRVPQGLERRLDNLAAAAIVYVGNYRLNQPWQSAQRRG